MKSKNILLSVCWFLLGMNLFAAGRIPGFGRFGYEDSSGCSSCGSSGEASAVPSLFLSLGSDLRGGEVGSIYLKGGESPDAEFATPIALRCSATSSDLNQVEIVQDDWGQIAQVVVPGVFVNVAVLSEYKYSITFYKTAAKGTWNSTSKRYSILNSSGNTLTVWTIENPEVGASFNKLRITENPTSGSVRIWNWIYTAATKTWSATEQGGSLEHRLIRNRNAAGNALTNGLQILEGGTLKSDKYTVTEDFSWGQGATRIVEGIPGEEKVTTRTYYSDATTAGYSPSSERPPIKEEVNPDSSWKYYYQYDSQGRPTVIFSGIATGISSDVTQTIKTEYFYNSLESGDDVSIESRTPRKEIVSYKGVITSVSYRVIKPTERREIRGISRTGSFSDSANLVTKTSYYSTGANAGRAEKVENEDGTMVFYSYTEAGGQRTVTVDRGEPNSGKTSILNGSRTVTVSGSLAETISVNEYDIAGGVVGIQTGKQEYSGYDDYRRPTKVLFLDNTYEGYGYQCCGLSVKTNRDGVVTQYMYDSRKRVVASLTSGITTTNILDLKGQVLETRRIGVDGSTSFLGGSTYNSVGLAAVSTNAFYGVSSATEDFDSGGYFRKTVINPDGGTKIQTFLKDGAAKEISGSAANPTVYEYGSEVTVVPGITPDPTLFFTKEIRVGDSGSTSEWTKSYEDLLGRVVKTAYSDGAAEYRFYNSKGQLIRSVDADGVATLFQYNNEGEVEYSSVDLNQNGTIDLAGLDRVTQTVRDVTTVSSVNVRRTRTYQLATDSSSTSLLINENRTSTDGLQNWSIAFGLTSQSTATINTGTGSKTVTVTQPDGSTTTSVYSFGRLQTATRKNSGGTQIGKSTYAYDSHGRVASVTDARNGATSYSYGAGDSVSSVTTPAPGTAASAQTSSNLYDTSGRAWKTVLADGTSTTNEFFPTGQLRKTYGSRSYPVEYTYDSQGRMKTLKTWQNFTGNSGAAVTTWNYHSTRGWLLSKDYPNSVTGSAGSTGPDYTYTPGGRLKTRAWARNHSGGSRIVTVYKYGFDDSISGNSHGDLTEVGYVDNGVTPTVNYVYDRRGRQVTVAQGNMTTTRAFNDAGQVLGESYSGGTLNGLSVNSTYDAYSRRDSLNFKNGATVLVGSTYGYDTASRLASVTDGTYSATYAYQADSSLVDTITFKSGTTTRLTTQKRFDRLNRLLNIASIPSAANQAIPSFAYQYNDANQRTRITLGDGSFWIYEYDTLGQVRSGKRYWSEGTPVAGQQFEYGFDDIGNRTNSKRGGDENGANLREATYSRNSLNQYDSRTSTGSRYVDVMGLATYNQAAPANVTVNGQTAYRRGEFWRSELGLAGSTALWQSVTINVGSTANSGSLFVPPTPEAFNYDLDGNIQTDGRWTYTWDAENRLTAMESLAGSPSDSKRKITFEYDANSRRIGKKVYVWNGTAYPVSPNTTLKFVYDGWNLLAELDGGNALVRSYQWGTDLSGSLQGAGGVGGLLSVKPSSGVAQFVAFDGNGNVAALVEGATGAVSANYEYGPFGELLRASGSQSIQPLRFSSKYLDAEIELVYYGYRYYSPRCGNWLSRDPIEERGGGNLYQYSFSDPIGNFDLNGLSSQCSVKTYDYRFDRFAFASLEWAGNSILPPNVDITGSLVFGVNIKKCSRCCRNGQFENDVTYTFQGGGNFSYRGPLPFPALAALAVNRDLGIFGTVSFEARASGDIKYDGCLKKFTSTRLSGGGTVWVGVAGRASLQFLKVPLVGTLSGEVGGTLMLRAETTESNVSIYLGGSLAVRGRFSAQANLHTVSYGFESRTEELKVPLFSMP